MSLDAQPIIAPYGTWKSPLDVEAVYRKSGVAVTDVLVDKVTGDVFHIEVSGFVYASFITSLAYHTLAFVGLFQSRPDEGGRFVLMRTLAGKGGDQRKEHVPLSIVPSSSSVRSKVHEYGGGASRIHGEFAYWSELSDGRVYRRLVIGGVTLGEVESVTPGD
jgi:hypothetical protein